MRAITIEHFFSCQDIFNCLNNKPFPVKAIDHRWVAEIWTYWIIINIIKSWKCNKVNFIIEYVKTSLNSDNVLPRMIHHACRRIDCRSNSILCIAYNLSSFLYWFKPIFDIIVDITAYVRCFARSDCKMSKKKSYKSYQKENWLFL